jgi:homocitrate synthase NifV
MAYESREASIVDHKTGFQIVDTTFRDGEQSAGVVFSTEEKINMAIALDRAGVSWIEAGTPAMGTEEQETLRTLLALPLRATLIAWNRADLADISASLSCGFSCIHISLPVSDLHIDYKLKKDRKWVINQLKAALQLVQSYGCDITVGAEDTSRADPEFFLRFADVAAKFGAMRIRFADTVGCLDPFMTFDRLQNLVSQCPLPIEFHGHNDFGLATANTLAAFQAGAKFASVTLAGIGERAGNASLEEVVASLEKFYGYHCGVESGALSSLAELVEKASNRPLFPYRPVVGSICRTMM